MNILMYIFAIIGILVNVVVAFILGGVLLGKFNVWRFRRKNPAERNKIMNNQQKYWDGRKNFIARLWYYLLQGLDLINSFKYLGAFIFGIYYTFKLPNPWMLVALFGISIPILLIAGYIKAFHINKVVDWLGTELGTHWGRYGYELQEKQIELLEKILKK